MTNLTTINNFDNFALNTEETANINGGANSSLSRRIRLGKNQRFGRKNNNFLDGRGQVGRKFSDYASFDFSGYDDAVAEEEIKVAPVMNSNDLSPDLVIL